MVLWLQLQQIHALLFLIGESGCIQAWRHVYTGLSFTVVVMLQASLWGDSSLHEALHQRQSRMYCSS